MNRFRQNVARRRMFALREMVRLEMPDRYDDLNPAFFRQVILVRPDNGNPPVRTAIWYAYQRRIRSAKNARASTRNMSDSQFLNVISEKWESAECLYLIVTTNSDTAEVSTDHISKSDWGDADQDGMPEFRDAWGRPIEFLRWAPGYVSALQPLYEYPTNDESDKRWKAFSQSHPRHPDDPSKLISHWNITIDKVIDNTAANVTKSGATRALVERMVIVPQEDPFNPLRVGSTPDVATAGSDWKRSTRWKPGDDPPENGYTLFPLIYSAGPNQRPGLIQGLRSEGYQYDTSPSDGFPDETSDIKFSDPYAYYKDAEGRKVMRGDLDRDASSFDNIHNHRFGTY
jgi:hypothetical protein